MVFTWKQKIKNSFKNKMGFIKPITRKTTTVLVEKVAGNFVDLPGVITEEGPIVHTNGGPIRGVTNGFGDHKVVSFLGVPYAKPPINALRFKPPQQLEAWRQTKETKTTQNACLQTPFTIPDFKEFVVSTQSEDCLYLNVFLPSELKEQANLPVMVWLHGGGFTWGSSTLEAYDGRYLALQSQAIIVTVNYRLGFLGFMRMGNVKGNMGLLDQKAALEWVRDNIAIFGGDPNKVTLFGQSAGASSVSLHLVSPLSSNLFQKAIMQSGSFLSPWSFVDVDTAEKRSNFVAQKVGCVNPDPTEVIKCLMGKSSNLLVETQLLDAQTLTPWFVPTIDGAFITEDPIEMLKDLKEKKPLLFGYTKHEGSYFTNFTLELYPTSQPQNLTIQEYGSKIEELFYYYPYSDKQELLSKTSEIISQYPPSMNFLQDFETITTAISDTWFVCPLNRFVSLYTSDNSYSYLFTQISSKLPHHFGSIHGLDLLFSFSTVIKYRQQGNYTENDIKLSEQIISFWSNFARTGNPNFGVIPAKKDTSHNGNYPSWPAYKADLPQYLTINQRFLNGTGQAVVEENFRNEYCSFWWKLLSF